MGILSDLLNGENVAKKEAADLLYLISGFGLNPEEQQKLAGMPKAGLIRLYAKAKEEAKHYKERFDTPAINRVWSMDFLQDALFNGSRFRILAIVDNYSKKCLSLLVGQSLKGSDVQQELSNIALVEGVYPERIQCDNGSEFISKEVDRWAYENKVTLDFSRPGKPTDNPYVESFNGKFRDECLSVNWFLSMEDASEKIEAWRWEYNHFRPHSSLNDLSPQEFIILHTNQPEKSISEYSG